MASATTGVTTAANVHHEVSIPFPDTPEKSIHIQLFNAEASLQVFVTSSSQSAGTSMGSLVVAMPQRKNVGKVSSTPVYVQGNTVDFAKRLAELLARKVGKPVHVANSISSEEIGWGETVAVQLQVLKRSADVIMELVAQK